MRFFKQFFYAIELTPQDTELGRAINHRPAAMAELEEKREKTRPLWTAMFPEEPFDAAVPPGFFFGLIFW